MALISDQRIVLLEIAMEFSTSAIALNEIIDHFYLNRVDQKIKNKRSETKYILSTFCRKLFELDNIIDQLTDKKISPRNIIVRNCIRIALIELIDLKHPDYAVINSWVEIAKKRKRLFHFSKFINAILRKFIKNNIKSNLSEKEKIPNWLWQSWEKHFGEKTSIKIIKSSLTEPPLDITYKPNFKNINEYPEVLPQSLRIFKPGKIIEIEGYDEGDWWVQDSGATIPVNIFGNINNKKVLDICSAPGGKSMQLVLKGANVTCVEISKKRIVIMKQNFDRTKLHPKIVNEDIIKWRTDEKFDFILIDAPCSATGTIRKNPDLIHIKDKKDINSHIDTQKLILQKASELLIDGGSIIYCVCSLQAEEGIGQIEHFLSSHNDFERYKIDAKDHPSYENFITKEGDIHTLPHLIADGGIDGFFISRLHKKY